MNARPILFLAVTCLAGCSFYSPSRRSEPEVDLAALQGLLHDRHARLLITDSFGGARVDLGEFHVPDESETFYESWTYHIRLSDRDALALWQSHQLPRSPLYSLTIVFERDTALQAWIAIAMNVPEVAAVVESSVRADPHTVVFLHP